MYEELLTFLSMSLWTLWKFENPFYTFHRWSENSCCQHVIIRLNVVVNVEQDSVCFCTHISFQIILDGYSFSSSCNSVYGKFLYFHKADATQVSNCWQSFLRPWGLLTIIIIVNCKSQGGIIQRKHTLLKGHYLAVFLWFRQDEEQAKKRTTDTSADCDNAAQVYSQHLYRNKNTIILNHQYETQILSF